MLNLADRGFFSMDRFVRFSAAGAHLAWRVKNAAKYVPFKTVRVLPDGSELVMLHEFDGMRTRRRRETGNRDAERLPTPSPGSSPSPSRRRHAAGGRKPPRSGC